MRRALGVLTALVLVVLAPVSRAPRQRGLGAVLITGLVAALLGLTVVAHATVSSIDPPSGETTPGGTASATVTVDSGILTTCLTATSDDTLNITVSFDGLLTVCGTGTWSSTMEVTVSTSIAPGVYTVTVQEIDLLGSVLESHPWSLTVTAPDTTTTTTTTTTTSSTTTTTTTSSTTTTTTVAETTTTTEAGTDETTTDETTTTTTSESTTDSDSTTTTESTDDTTGLAAGGGEDGGEPGDDDGSGLGLRQPQVGLESDFATGMFGSTSQVLGFEIDAGFTSAVELVEASWYWVLGLALLIAAVLIKGIDLRLGRAERPVSDS